MGRSPSPAVQTYNPLPFPPQQPPPPRRLQVRDGYSVKDLPFAGCETFEKHRLLSFWTGIILNFSSQETWGQGNLENEYIIYGMIPLLLPYSHPPFCLFSQVGMVYTSLGILMACDKVGLLRSFSSSGGLGGTVSRPVMLSALGTEVGQSLARSGELSPSGALAVVQGYVLGGHEDQEACLQLSSSAY